MHWLASFKQNYNLEHISNRCSKINDVEKDIKVQQGRNYTVASTKPHMLRTRNSRLPNYLILFVIQTYGTPIIPSCIRAFGSPLEVYYGHGSHYKASVNVNL